MPSQNGEALNLMHEIWHRLIACIVSNPFCLELERLQIPIAVSARKTKAVSEASCYDMVAS